MGEKVREEGPFAEWVAIDGGGKKGDERITLI